MKTTIQPVFISRKLYENLKVGAVKPATANQKCQVYKFNVTCVMQDVLVTLAATSYEHVDGHKQNHHQFVDII